MPSLLLACLAFLGISLPDGLLGIAWPSMRADLNLPVAALSLLLPLEVASFMLSSASTGALLARIGLGRLLAASIALTGLALFGQSVAPAFWVLLLTGVVLAAGNGAIDVGLNAHAARRFNARQITWMHAVYGFGAAAGPLLFAAMAGVDLSWRWTFAVVAAIQCLLAVTFALTVRVWHEPAPDVAAPDVAAPDVAAPDVVVPDVVVPAAAPGVVAPAAAPGVVAPAPRPRHLLRVPAAVWPGAVVFLVLTGVEAATALWAFLFLTEGRGVAFGVAAGAASGYWAALLIGRLVLGPVADRVGTRPVLQAGLAGMVGGAALLFLPGPLAVAGIVLIGLSAAPMYPLLTLTTKDRVGADLADRAIGIQAAASAFGSAMLPALIGLLIAPFGAGVIAPCVLVLAVLLAVAYRAARR